MKKVLLSLAVAFGMIASANAQLVVGGGIDFSGNVTKTSANGNWGATDGIWNTYSKKADFGFGFAPKVGYIINGNLEVGGKLRLAYDQETFYVPVENVSGTEAAKNAKEHMESDFSWAINPYARYRLFDVKGFGFWLQGEASLGTSMEHKSKYYAYGSATELENGMSPAEPTRWRSSDAATAANKKVDGHKYSCFNGSFYVKPVLTYDIDEHWTIESELNLLSFGIGGYVEKVTDKGTNRAGDAASIANKENYFYWGLGLKQGQTLSLGVTYKF